MEPDESRFKMWSIPVAGFIVMLFLVAPLRAVDLPPELPLWEQGPPGPTVRLDAEEEVRSHKAPPGSPSGLYRAFSSVSSPTYSIHRPENANGVGLVICPVGEKLDNLRVAWKPARMKGRKAKD